MEKRKGFASPFLLIYSKFHKEKEKSLKKKTNQGKSDFNKVRVNLVSILFRGRQ